MTSKNNSQPKSMKTFLFIWVGQLISMIGSGLTGFGLSVYIYTETGKATPIALNALFYNLPTVLLQPVAGSWADRYNRRRIMILADCGAALTTLGVVALLFSGKLEIWHIYLSTALVSSFNAFQSPAYRASISMIVPKKHLARAGGIEQTGFAIQSLLTPMIAGALYEWLGLQGLIAIDFLSFFFAVGALMLVHIPQPKYTASDPEAEKSSTWRDAKFGWQSIRQQPGLFGLLWYYAIVNFFLTLSSVLITPLILSFSGTFEMGLVQMVGGAAMLIGGVLMGIWGGPDRKRIWFVIATIALSGTGFLIAGLQRNIWLIAIGQFVILFFIPLSSAVSRAVWQVKVPPSIQGRVFAVRAMIAYSIMPLANLAAGPLADQIFEPLMDVQGALSHTWVGELIGVGQGRGIGLIFIISAISLGISSFYAFANPRIRNLEEEIPDAIPDEEEEEALFPEGAVEAAPAA